MNGNWRWLIVIVVAAYAPVIAVMYAAQTPMMFPTGIASAGQPFLPASAVRLEFETPDGERLHGVHIAPAAMVADKRLVVLGFGGNAWKADDLADFRARTRGRTGRR